MLKLKNNFKKQVSVYLTALRLWQHNCVFCHSWKLRKMYMLEELRQKVLLLISRSRKNETKNISLTKTYFLPDFPKTILFKKTFSIPVTHITQFSFRLDFSFSDKRQGNNYICKITSIVILFAIPSAAAPHLSSSSSCCCSPAGSPWLLPSPGGRFKPLRDSNIESTTGPVTSDQGGGRKWRWT